jgi:Kazal-type serine protease inhibitor domain
MNRVLALSFIAAVAGCGTPDESYDDVVTDLDGKTDNVNSAKSILPEGAPHLYFNTALGAYVNDDFPLSYSWFTAAKGGEFTVSVTEDDGTGRPVAGEHIGFKLQRAVKHNGKWSWSVVGQGEGEDGEAGVSYTPKSGPGLYLVTATASPLPAQLTVYIKCGGGGCATAPQPGDACGSRCDDGLFCSYTLDQQCGDDGSDGVCAVRGNICPKFYKPTCGCDGHTYGNNCEANAGGTSVARVGSCDVDIVGGWEYINGAHYDYTFNPDGTFISTQQPACAFTNPRCLIRIAPATGVYSVGPTSLFLTYTSDFRSGETAELTWNRSQTHLTGADWSTKLDLTRLR